MRRALREAKAGVDDDRVPGDARRGRTRDSGRQFLRYLRDDVGVGSFAVHLAGPPRLCIRTTAAPVSAIRHRDRDRTEAR